MKGWPRAMMLPHKAGEAHYYIDPTGIAIYPNGQDRVRLTKRQLEQIVQVLYDYVPNTQVDGGK